MVIRILSIAMGQFYIVWSGWLGTFKMVSLQIAGAVSCPAHIRWRWRAINTSIRASLISLTLEMPLVYFMGINLLFTKLLLNLFPIYCVIKCIITHWISHSIKLIYSRIPITRPGFHRLLKCLILIVNTSMPNLQIVQSLLTLLYKCQCTVFGGVLELGSLLLFTGISICCIWVQSQCSGLICLSVECAIMILYIRQQSRSLLLQLYLFIDL